MTGKEMFSIIEKLTSELQTEMAVSYSEKNYWKLEILRELKGTILKRNKEDEEYARSYQSWLENAK